VVAIDAGTTGVRSLVFDSRGTVVTSAYRELTQHFPQPGWVEHDAAEIWRLVESTLALATAEAIDRNYDICAVGVTNQRETAVAWDRGTGATLHRAIVWQDRRTAARCDALRDEGHLATVRERTGLVLDPYFSATKWAYMLEEGGVSAHRLALSTVDAWIIWNLAGAAEDIFVTDVTNASRTLCLDIRERAWSPELCEIFGVPLRALPQVRPSSGRLGVVSRDVAGGALAGVPISGVAGDQQAALFGQACFAPGETKVTYGTGTFVLANIGDTIPSPVEGLLTTIAWELSSGPDRPATGCTYALEGAIFSSGAAIQWLRDGLGVIRDSSEIGPLAASAQGSAALGGIHTPAGPSSA
jgi:glycerol kinase